VLLDRLRQYAAGTLTGLAVLLDGDDPIARANAGATLGSLRRVAEAVLPDLVRGLRSAPAAQTAVNLLAALAPFAVTADLIPATPRSETALPTKSPDQETT
jgi:hypothetical protein